MGNGQRVSQKIIVDVESTSISQKDIEDAAIKALSSFGIPQQIFVPYNFNFIGTGLSFDINPEYVGTPWSATNRMTKRERAVAGLHTTLKKLGVLKNIDEQSFEEIRNKSIQRLKRAKWARYQQQKKV